MKNWSYGVLLLTVVTALAGCSSSPDEGKTTVIDINSISSNRNLTSQQKAAELADAGEQLLSAQGFVYAEQVFEVALAIDPENKKAGFYKRLMAFLMTDRGIIMRVKGLALRTPEGKTGYEKLMWEFEGVPETSMTRFLLDDSQKEIQSEGDFLGYLESKVNALEDLRQWLRRNKQSSFTLIGTDSMLDGLSRRMIEECAAVENERGVYEVNCKNWKERLRKINSIQVNGADLEAIQHMVAGLELMFIVYSSYDLSGAIAASLDQSFSVLTGSEKLNVLLRNPDFGTLRKGSKLRQVPEMGADLIAGARWLKSIQSDVCGKPGRNFNRPGYLFNQGFCLTQNPEDPPMEQTMMALERILGGGKINQTYELKTGLYETSTVPMAPLLNPIRDVRQLGLAPNACGDLMPSGDPTVGGLFPKKDGLIVLEGLSKCGN